MFYILPIIAAKSGKAETWVFPATLGESAWATLSKTHFSFEYILVFSLERNISSS